MPTVLPRRSAHRSDRRALLDVVAGAEAARTLARNRGDERCLHALGGGENDPVRAAGGEVDGAGLEGLGALVRAGELGRIERVGLAIVFGQIGLRHQQPDGFLGGPAVAETKYDRLRARRVDGCGQRSRHARRRKASSPPGHDRGPRAEPARTGDGAKAACINRGIFERHGRQPMRAGPEGRIRAPAGPHSRANPLLIARSLCTINSPMSVSARPFRANTFFAQPWAENSQIRLPSKPPCHAGRALERWSARGKSSKGRGTPLRQGPALRRRTLVAEIASVASSRTMRSTV